jgi:hypothetical protein
VVEVPSVGEDAAARAEAAVAAARRLEEGRDRSAARQAWLDAAELCSGADRFDLMTECALVVRPLAAFMDDDAEVRALVAAAREHARGDALLWLDARLIRMLPPRDQGVRRGLALRLVEQTSHGADPRLAIAAELSFLDAFWAPQHLAERLTHVDRAVALAVVHGHLDLELEARLWRFVLLLEAARIAEAAEEVSSCEELAAASGRPDVRLHATVRRACLEMLEARYESAERSIDEVVALAAEAGSPDQELVEMTQRSVLAFETGDAAALRASMSPIFWQRLPHSVLAGLAALSGQLDLARRELTVGMRELPDASGPRGSAMLAQAAMAADALSDREAGELLIDRLEPLRGGIAVIAGGVAAIGPIDHFVALAALAAGDLATARTAAEASRALSRRIGAPGWAERSARLLDRIEGERGTGAVAASAGPEVALRQDGAGWSVLVDRSWRPLGSKKGFRQLAMLLDRPGQRVHVSQLADVPVGAVAPPVLDAVALTRYRARLTELDAAQERADRRGDAAASERLAAEQEALEREIRSARGLGGRARTLGSDVERVRVNVTRTIRHAIADLAEHAPAAAVHLDATVHTGTYCSYDPDHPSGPTS